VRVLIAGDFVPTRRLAGLSTIVPRELFGEFADRISGADLAILNLEAPLCEPLLAIEKTGPNMHAPVENAKFVAKAGFDLATLANNHVFDFGAQGLESTMAALDEIKVAYVGAGVNLKQASEPYLAVCDGIKVAILNFAENEWSTTRGSSAGACPIDPVSNFRAIRDAARQADHVIVICHGGHEMYALPSPRMKQLFRFYVEAGASAVVNHHPHCVSGYEVFEGAPIFYSLGNFLFDHDHLRAGPWTQGMAVELIFSGDSLDYEIDLFDQCTEDTLFRLCDAESRVERLDKLDALNQIINDDERLESSFLDYSEAKARQYLRYLEPVRSRLLFAAQNRGLAPTLLSRRQKRLLLNVIRCEAHRDLVLEILDRDVGSARRSKSRQSADQRLSGDDARD